MKIIFFGTPDYVVPVLESLAKVFKIVAVVTQKPKPVGRKQFLTYSPVDDWAHKHKVPIYFDPADIIKNNIHADLGVLASFGQIISDDVLTWFPKGIINIHPSLLPKYRGASPISAAIEAQDTTTGVTFIKLDSKLDHGPIISQFKEEIHSDDNTGSLRSRLFERSKQVLIDLIPAYLTGKINLKIQDEKAATYTKQLTKDYAYIPWEDLAKYNPQKLDCLIRAMYPWPIVWTLLRLPASEGQAPKRLKLLKAHVEDDKIALDEVQLEGKNPVSWKQFKQAYDLSCTF